MQLKVATVKGWFVTFQQKLQNHLQGEVLVHTELPELPHYI